MNTPARPELVPGRAYRTRDLRPWSANPTRLARRLVDEGKLREAAHGLYYAPLLTRFGPAPASSEELLRAFLGGERFLVTGPPFWNALGLGSTAMFAVTLVYNTRRSGEFQLGGRRFLLRRVYFPENPSAEWFIVDLLQHHDMAGAGLTAVTDSIDLEARRNTGYTFVGLPASHHRCDSVGLLGSLGVPHERLRSLKSATAVSDLRAGLVATLRAGRWDRERLRAMAQTHGTKATLAVVEEALRETERAA